MVSLAINIKKGSRAKGCFTNFGDEAVLINIVKVKYKASEFLSTEAYQRPKPIHVHFRVTRNGAHRLPLFLKSRTLPRTH